MLPSNQKPSPTVISADHLTELSRWGRVALAARAGMRLAPWFLPSPSRPLPTAHADILAVDVCTTLAALAAVNGRPLSTTVTETAARAAMGAMVAPRKVPLAPSDHAAMVAGLALEWSTSVTFSPSFDAGSLEAVRAVFDDVGVLLAAGLGVREDGVEPPAPKEFFARPLWPVKSEQWERELSRWQIVLAPHGLSELVERYRRLGNGPGMDLADAQRRAEVWVKENASAEHGRYAPASAPSPPEQALSPVAPADGEQPLPKPPLLRPELIAPTPTLHVLTPANASAADYSDLQPYANAMAGMIDFLDSQSTFTVAIQGAQGSGRSVLSGMLERRLMQKPSVHGDQPHLTLRVTYSDVRHAPSVAGVLMRKLAETLDRERPLLSRHLGRMVWTLQPKGAVYFHIAAIAILIFLLAGLAGSALLLMGPIPSDWVPQRHDLIALLKSIGLQGSFKPAAVLAAIAAFVALGELFGFTRRVGGALGAFVRDPKGSVLRGEVPKVRPALGSLIRGSLARGSRIVIFVEDLERCGPERSMEFLASIDELYQFPELVFVLLTEGGILARHAADYYRGAGGGAQQINRYLDLQVDLPSRPMAPAEALAPASSRSRSRSVKKKDDVVTLLLGSLQRDWRGESRFPDVVLRTLYVNPPYLVPVVVMFWTIFGLPVWEFITVQGWFYHPRCRRIFSKPGRQISLYLLALVLIGHGVLVCQTLNSLLLELHYVILYPETRALSTWVFVPIELGNLLLVGILAAWNARAAKEEERHALAQARAQLRQKIDRLRSEGADDPVQVARLLVGVTPAAASEDMLIREAVEESFLLSREQRPLDRLKLFLDLDKGMAA